MNKKSIDTAKLRELYPVGSLFRIRNVSWYFKKTLKVVSVHETAGICAEDEDETVSVLATKVKHLFGWPPLNLFEKDGLVDHLPATTEVAE